MVRAGIILLSALLLAGCVTDADRQRTNALVEARYAQCDAKYPKPQYVAQAKCYNAADTELQSPPYPDLDNLRKAKRVELAERHAAGKITRAQVDTEFAQTISYIIGEVTRRDAARSAAIAASIPPPPAAPAPDFSYQGPRSVHCSGIRANNGIVYGNCY